MREETIYDLLKRDHETVRGILDKLGATNGAATRARLFEQLKAALLPHMHAEELVFYKTLRTEKASHEPALDAKEEHRAATHTLHELERLSPENELWKARFHVLRESIEHHIREEEGKVFKAAKAVLDRDQAVVLGQQFLDEKQAYTAGREAVRATG